MSNIYYINSYNRTEGTNSNFTYYLPHIPSNVNKVVMLSASIPKSYYLIEDGLNTFTLIEDEDEIIITIPPGNYNRRSFSVVLQNLLNDASALDIVYTISYANTNQSEDDGKYTFTVSDNNDVQPIFQFSTNDDAHEAMGFNAESSNQFVNDELKSTNVIRLFIEDTIFIHSNICQNENDNILQEIYTGGNLTFSSILFENKCPEYYAKNMSYNTSKVFKFYLTDENDLEIDLQGQNFVCTLKVYRENNMYQLVKDFIQYFISKKERL